MKRIVMIAVALVLLFSNLIPAAAMPEGVKYSSTYAFLKELDEYDVIYTYKGIDEDTDEWVYVSYGLSNDADCDLNIFFTSDCEHCVIRIWNLIDFDAAQVNTMYMVCNYLNSSYKYATFYVDESDYSVTVSYDLIFRDDDCGEICYEAMRRLVHICDDAMTVLDGFRK